MPSGRVHTTINLTVLGLTGAAVHFGGLPVSTYDAATVAAAYLVGTLLITPDLDLAEQRVQARNNWGLLGWIWIPFGVMSRHRGLNHTYLLGPALRLGYLALIAVGLWAVITSVWPDTATWQPPHVSGRTLLLCTAGYWTSQALHLIADGIRPFSTLRTRENA